MNTWTPDTVSAEAMFCAMRGSVPAVTMAQCAAILAAIRSGKIPLPEDGPQIAALRARVAVLEAVVADMNRRLAEACLSAPSAGHDLVDEVCGLLRVARSQRDAAWASWGAERKLRHDAMPPLTTDETT